MSGPALIDNGALILAIAATAAAALSLASRLVPGGPYRVLAAVPFGAALAVLEALVLGRFGLGGSTTALTLLAVSAALVITRLAGRPRLLSPADVVDRLRGISWPALIGVGAVAGGFMALTAVQAHRPVIGEDAITYHLAEAVGWVQSGHTGTVLPVYYGLPVGNYPITEEVLLSWGMGIAHGFGPALLMTLATLPLLWFAGWLGLGELGVPRPVRALTIAAFSSVPLIVTSWVMVGNDLEAVAWLTVCAALCLASRTRPALLAAAILAGALAIGTKTTVLSYTAAILAVAIWSHRSQLRRHRTALLGTSTLGAVTGLVWYVRNWVTHGSPLWPFSSFPGGDPEPPFIRWLSTTLLQRPQATLFDHLGAYLFGVSGGVALIVLGVAVAAVGAVVRQRRLVLAGVVVLLGTLEYAAGPLTGLPPHEPLLLPFVGSTLRYMMPAFAAGAIALALAASDGRRPIAACATLSLCGTLVWNFVSLHEGTFPVPYNPWLLVGAVAGAMLAATSGAFVRRRESARSAHDTDRRRVPTQIERAAGSAGVLAVWLLGAAVFMVASTHFVERQVRTDDYRQAIAAFVVGQPGYADSHAPVATTPTGFATLAGDRLQHRISVVPVAASCAKVRLIHQRSWMVVALPLAPMFRRALPADVATVGTAVGCLQRARVRPVLLTPAIAVYAPLRP